MKLLLMFCLVGFVAVCKSQDSCVVDGVTYGNGEEIPSGDPCNPCWCHVQAGRVCAALYCSWPRCDPGQVVTYYPGQCCPGCEPVQPVS